MECAEIAHRCFRCGYCKFTDDYLDFNCPSYRASGLDTFAPGGRMWLINAWLRGEVENSERYAQILYSCATCGNCEKRCVFDFKKDILGLFESAKAELVERGMLPPAVRDYLKAVASYGNPYKRPRDERAGWADGTGIPAYSGQDFLFYVGDAGSYDERGKKMARAVGTLLMRGGVSIGILGSEELSDGNDVKALGEEGLFTELARKNIQTFRNLGVNKVITLDPHSFNVFTKEYPKLGGKFAVWHYSQVLARILQEKKLALSDHNLTVTYHDPCYLGRHNGIYDLPRDILRSIPGVKLVEMPRHKENSFCCGGGGGNFFTDVLAGGREAPARLRLREAAASGAEVLVVACPLCAKMFEEAVKAEAADGAIEVADIAEVIAGSLSD